ncbi:MAG: methylmalonyl-CoA mutase [Actinomycetota bacterium]|nr:methylmalonyl-CoA mutase [Actinomycetota bacterium]
MSSSRYWRVEGHHEEGAKEAGTDNNKSAATSTPGSPDAYDGLSNAGMEVIYTSRYQTPRAIAEAAIAEDVGVIDLSDHTGSLSIIAGSVLEELRELDSTDIAVIAGSLLAPKDIEALKEMGVSGNYGPGTPIEVIIDHVNGPLEPR